MSNQTLPSDVQTDLENGFIVTDIDDLFQRCKTLSPTSFHYKSGTEKDNNVDDEVINVANLSDQEKEDAISAYYGTIAELSEKMDGHEESINMIVAECYFETEFMRNY
jgi:hypothetical protein